MKTIILLSAFLFSIEGLCQNIIVVDNNSGATADYASIQDASNAAEDGDFIYVIPSSTSYGNVSVTTEVHIRGLGHYPLGTNNLASEISTVNFSAGSSNSSISGMRVVNSIVGSATSGVTISNCFAKYITVGGNDWTIEGSIINNDQVNVHAISVNNHENLTIHHNFIRHSSSLNVAALFNAPESTLEFNNLYVLDDRRLMGNSNNIEFQNSIFLSLAESDNLIFSGSAGWSFNNCLSYNYNGFTVALTGGTNNLEDVDPQFENIQSDSPLFQYGNNYNPADGSPLINAGSDGNNIGFYSDNFAFDQRGHAIDLPYITTIDILNPSVAAGEEIQIDFSAFGN